MESESSEPKKYCRLMKAHFIGIDVGTQGVRVILASENGDIAGSQESKIALTDNYRVEQSPEEWWEAVQECLHKLINGLPADFNRQSIKAVSVTSTSGTVIPLDAANNPLHQALMYSDSRSEAEGKVCRQTAISHNPEGYTAFNASSGLSKMVWFVNHFPEKTSDIRTWVHAADFIIGRLSGNYRTTDFTNALKSGYDITRSAWPAYIYEQLPIRKEWLQEVVPSGTPIGLLTEELSHSLQFPAITVVSGMTDGCASQVASGAVNPGDWNTTIGTTLVIKGVTKNEIKDPEGRLYCHRHPEGYWMPGGASNTGADWISTDFSGDNLSELNKAAEILSPTPWMVYPLKQEGERFPFISKLARGFADDDIPDKENLFTAGMEGVAYIERLSFELVEKLSGEKPTAVFTAGGGSNSDIWLKIRSSVLNCPVHKMTNTSGALGAGILAASKIHFTNLGEAAAAMTHTESITRPETRMVNIYEKQYQNFKKELERRGYL
jgi:sugar (pentulose or hexulose) kinase